MKFENDRYTLTTGRTFYANRGIVGIAPDGSVTEGYDGGIAFESDWDETFVPWSDDEKAELADAMIQRWTVFKTKA